MKKQFSKPFCEAVRFGGNIIASSLCPGNMCDCNVAGIEMGGDWCSGDANCPNLNLPQCECGEDESLNCS